MAVACATCAEARVTPGSKGGGGVGGGGEGGGGGVEGGVEGGGGGEGGGGEGGGGDEGGGDEGGGGDEDGGDEGGGGDGRWPSAYVQVMAAVGVRAGAGTRCFEECSLSGCCGASGNFLVDF